MAHTELKDFSVHLGSHDFGIESPKDRPGFTDHKLSEPEEGVKGLDLPFINFAARDKEAADQFIKTVNWLAVQYNMGALDIARLVRSADELTGK